MILKLIEEINGNIKEKNVSMNDFFYFFYFNIIFLILYMCGVCILVKFFFI